MHDGRLVAAVGHVDVVDGRGIRGHGGLLNAFGRDFAASGLAWTPALCARDSDGDGKSNGVELGDPLCVWSRGGVGGVESGGDVDSGSAFDAFGPPSGGVFHFGLVLTHPGVSDRATGHEHQRRRYRHFASLRPSETRQALNIRRELSVRKERERQARTEKPSALDLDSLVSTVVIVGCDREDAERVARALRNDAQFSGRVMTSTPANIASALSELAAMGAGETPLTLVVSVVSATKSTAVDGDGDSAMRCEVDLANNKAMLDWHSPVVVHTDVWGAEVAALWIRHLVASERRHCGGDDDDDDEADGGLVYFCATGDRGGGGSGEYDEEDEDFEEDLDEEDFDDDAFEED
jgi:hypothetical protein